MQTPTIQVVGDRQFVALVQPAPERPAHHYTYGASRPELRPVVES